MKSAVQIVGVFILIGSVSALFRFLKERPNFDLLGDQGTAGEFMGMLMMSVVGIGLVVYGIKKRDKKTQQDKQTEDHNKRM